MKSSYQILVTGASGFVGQALCRELFIQDYALTLIARHKNSFSQDFGIPAKILLWDPTIEECPYNLNHIDAVIHLMGESIAAGRWTNARKSRLMNSRILATRRLAAALSKRKSPLNCFISASAIGYYPYDSQESLLESSAAGSHFLAELCQEWEAAALEVRAVRSVILRFGIVLGHDGGTMSRLREIFALGLGGSIGSGTQSMSWIHRDDLIDIIQQALRHSHWTGIYNCVSPNPVTNLNFTHALAKKLQRKAFIPIPASILKLAFGSMSDILLKSQRISCERLLQQGFIFKFPELDRALDECCSITEKEGRAFPCHRFETTQFIAESRDEVFSFFSSPYNLEKITPNNLNFKILAMNSPNLSNTSIIDYQLKIHGIPFKWKTLIKNWEPNRQFIDIQIKGPYSIWHHTHRFLAAAGGTLIIDEVRFRLPMGWLGELLGMAWVRREIKGIFAFRRKSIAKIFPPAKH